MWQTQNYYLISIQKPNHVGEWWLAGWLVGEHLVKLTGFWHITMVDTTLALHCSHSYRPQVQLKCIYKMVFIYLAWQAVTHAGLMVKTTSLLLLPMVGCCWDKICCHASREIEHVLRSYSVIADLKIWFPLLLSTFFIVCWFHVMLLSSV